MGHRDGRAGYLAAETARAPSGRADTSAPMDAADAPGGCDRVGLCGLGVLYFYYWRRRGWRKPLGAMWLGLVTAALLAASLTAAQLLPVMEFMQRTTRATAAGPHGIYVFSVEPIRVAELLWPDIGGMPFGENSYWPDAVKIPGVYPRIWVPSLYLGGMTFLLALCALSLRHGPPWRVWVSAIAILSSLGGMGQYTSPIWAARTALAAANSPRLERLAGELGPLRAPGDAPIRQDGFLKDGDGSIYWWMATVLPGFRQFRYPAKLFSLTSLALAALAGAGWDSISAGHRRRAIVTSSVLIGLSLCILAGVAVWQQPILEAFRSYAGTAETGPLDAAGSYAAIVRSLVHSLIVLGLSLVIFKIGRARPRLAGAAALVLMTIDLAAANSRYVMTVPQSLFDRRPMLVKIIEKAEADRNPPKAGPFRVHRMHEWSPVIWNVTRSPEREADIVAWERDTIGAKYGINFGINYTHSTGSGELSDHEWYFAALHRVLAGPEIASWLGTKVGEPVIYLPAAPMTCGTRVISSSPPLPTAGATRHAPRLRSDLKASWSIPKQVASTDLTERKTRSTGSTHRITRFCATRRSFLVRGSCTAPDRSSRSRSRRATFERQR